MGVFVKICGIANEEDAAAVGEMKPDAMGFIFYPPSPRCAEPKRVKEWVSKLPADIRKVGVFVDLDPATVNEIVSSCGLDVAQLHGNETPEIADKISVETWKAVHLDRMTAGGAEAYHVDALLVDSYSTAMPGGTGKTVDWNLAAMFIKESSQRVLLAGGLKPGNVEEAIRRTLPWGVDVSSGVESEPGKKDLLKVQEFIALCRKN